MYQANIILSIECILYSNGFYNSQRVLIIHLNYDNLFDWKKAKKERYDLPRECILSFSNGFHNSCRNYSHSILHNPSRRRESFRLKQNRGTSYIYIRCADITLWKGRFFLVERRFDCISPSEHCPPAGKNDFSAGQYFDSDLNANEMERSRPFLAVTKTFLRFPKRFSLSLSFKLHIILSFLSVRNWQSF